MSKREPTRVKIIDRKTFEGLFNIYYESLCAFANSYLRNKEQSEDTVQEVFVALWNQRESLNEILSLKSFLYTSVRNKCLNQIKHQKVLDKHFERETHDKEGEAYFIDHLIEEETHRLIFNALDELPPRCREIIILSINGLKNSEIAEELDISVNTIKTQKAIAYKHLRVKLKYLLAFSPFFLMNL